MSGAFPTDTPGWLVKLRAERDQPPRRPRVPLRAGSAVIGSVEPDFLHQIASAAVLDGRAVLQAEESSAGVRCWQVHGELTASLHAVAQALHRAGLGGAWRDEQLAVCDEEGRRAGTVERAAVRPLGITTWAVHLVGETASGRIWVQQRALDKANDPGLWDTLMGGMVPAADTLQEALARETWEEAGLRLDALRDIVQAGRLTTRRPATDGRGAGYVVEHIDWFRCTIPEALAPVNQDGEVAQFRLMDRPELQEKMERGEFTTEAALILSDVLAL